MRPWVGNIAPIIPPTTDFSDGQLTPQVSGEAGTGSPITAATLNDIAYAIKAVIKAYGSLSGTPESETASDFLTALQWAISHMEVPDGTITAPKLSGLQTGTAPAYAVRAWVNFNSTIGADMTGTYSQTGTTVTVTIMGHGVRTNDYVYLDFTSGTAVDGTYAATKVSNDVFTIQQTTPRTTSGNVTMKRFLVVASGNVSSVARIDAKNYIINFTIPMPDANYAVTFGQTIGVDGVTGHAQFAISSSGAGAAPDLYTPNQVQVGEADEGVGLYIACVAVIR